MIITKRVSNLRTIFRFKAPKGFQYLISGIHCSVVNQAATVVSVLPYLVEDGITIVNVTSQKEYLAVFSLVENNMQNMVGLNEKTKYFTIAMSDTTASSCFVHIVYELVKISRNEAIMEWFRKGR